jgi:MFS family permease
MADTPTVANGETVETKIPARLDRLPWSRWHLRILTALGTSWLLDGLEVTLVGSLAGLLSSPQGLALTDEQVTGGATTYLAGAVFGALLFGYLTDRLGRKRLFLVTVATYSLATLTSAFSWNFWSFAIFRALTGVGIGGEYAAINSAVDELIPGRIRGTVDLVVNGTFWIGGAIGSLASIYLLSGHAIGGRYAWRYAFGIGGLLGVIIFVLRLTVPESPRWLMLRGQEQRANDVVDEIESRVTRNYACRLPKPEGDPLKIKVRDHTPGVRSSPTCSG